MIQQRRQPQLLPEEEAQVAEVRARVAEVQEVDMELEDLRCRESRKVLSTMLRDLRLIAMAMAVVAQVEAATVVVARVAVARAAVVRAAAPAILAAEPAAVAEKVVPHWLANRKAPSPMLRDLRLIAMPMVVVAQVEAATAVALVAVALAAVAPAAVVRATLAVGAAVVVEVDPPWLVNRKDQ